MRAALPSPGGRSRDVDCIGCGYCCHDSLCGLAYGYHGGRVLPCPSLVLVLGRYRCGLYRLAERPMRAVLAYALGIGHGCPNEDIRQLAEMGQELARLAAAPGEKGQERPKVKRESARCQAGATAPEAQP